MQQKAPEKKTPGAPRQFTPEFRAGAVRLVMEEGRSQDLVAKDLGVAKSVIARWPRDLARRIALNWLRVARIEGDRQRLSWAAVRIPAGWRGTPGESGLRAAAGPGNLRALDRGT